MFDDNSNRAERLTELINDTRLILDDAHFLALEILTIINIYRVNEIDENETII